MSRWFTAQSDPHLWKCPCNRPECDAPKPSDALLEALDRLREYVNRPIIITSGVRCADRNMSIGGELDSEHVLGTAADLWAPTGATMYELTEAAMAVGIVRIGNYVDKHVHIDVSRTKPQRVMWVK